MYYGDGTDVDFTNLQMVVTMKMTAFAYNYGDGEQFSLKLEKNEAESKRFNLYPSQRKMAIERLPGIVNFFGYVYCFLNVLSGPAFEYNEYINGISSPKKDLKRSSPTWPALRVFGVGVAAFVFNLVMSGYFPTDTLKDPTVVGSRPLYVHYFYILVALTAFRFQYHAVWKIAEATCINSHLGYDDEKQTWSKAENSDILGFELTCSTQQGSKAWNKHTQNWLEKFIYHRHKKNMFLVYLNSALWHGVYPGYFFFFLGIGMQQACERYLKSIFNPLFVPKYNYKEYPNSGTLMNIPKTGSAPYWFLCWIMTHGSSVLVFQNYVLRRWEEVLFGLKTFNYFSLLVFVPIIFVSHVLKVKPETVRNIISRILGLDVPKEKKT